MVCLLVGFDNNATGARPEPHISLISLKFCMSSSHIIRLIKDQCMGNTNCRFCCINTCIFFHITEAYIIFAFFACAPVLPKPGIHAGKCLNFQGNMFYNMPHQVPSSTLSKNPPLFQHCIGAQSVRASKLPAFP